MVWQWQCQCYTGVFHLTSLGHHSARISRVLHCYTCHSRVTVGVCPMSFNELFLLPSSDPSARVLLPDYKLLDLQDNSASTSAGFDRRGTVCQLSQSGLLIGRSQQPALHWLRRAGQVNWENTTIWRGEERFSSHYNTLMTTEQTNIYGTLSEIRTN